MDGKRIITGKDYARREGMKTVKELIQRWSAKMYQRGQLDTPFVDKPMVGKPLVAEINHGQWITHCDQCSTPMWVDPDEPMFYCFGCGNRHLQGRPRPVLFPPSDEREQIESLLLERPVDDRRGTNDIDRAFHALPLAIGLVGEVVVSLDRSWKPDETLDDLREQNTLIDPLVKAREALGLTHKDQPAKQAYLEAIGHFALEREHSKKSEES